MVLLKFHVAPVVESQSLSRTRNTWLLTASQEGLDVLSAALRDERLPDHSEGFVEQMIVAVTSYLDPS